MVQSGRVVFGRMEEVVFGRPAAEAVAEAAQWVDANRVFLMVSGTLARQTNEIDKVRRQLGNRCAGIFDRMPPHTKTGCDRSGSTGARDRCRPNRHDWRRLCDRW
jgi:maleylacetate reductase